MVAILATSTVGFLAIFIFCLWDYKRIPAEEIAEKFDTPSLELTTIGFAILKVLVLIYAFYVISRQVIGFPETETLWALNWNFPLIVIISLLSSAPLVWYQAVRQKSKSTTLCKITLLFVLCLAVFVSGFGQILIAALSSSTPLFALGRAPIFALIFSLITGMILTVSANIHFDFVLNLHGTAKSELNPMFVKDSFNAAFSSVLSILVGASFWTLSVL